MTSEDEKIDCIEINVREKQFAEKILEDMQDFFGMSPQNNERDEVLLYLVVMLKAYKKE